jgi:hypothetical protein
VGRFDKQNKNRSSRFGGNKKANCVDHVLDGGEPTRTSVDQRKQRAVTGLQADCVGTDAGSMIGWSRRSS